MFMTRICIALGALILVAGMVGTAVYSGQVPADKDQVADKRVSQADDKNGERAPSAPKVQEKKHTDPAKESLRLANKLLQEEIEDEKAKLEALQKKLERLKKSGIQLPQEDPVTAELRRENRKLQQELRRLQDDVRSAQEEVLPYMQALQRGAGGQRAFQNFQGFDKR